MGEVSKRVGASSRLTWALAFGALAGALLLVSCQQVGESSIQVLATPAGGASLAADVQPILTARCALCGCHAAPSPGVCDLPEALPGAIWEEGKSYRNLVNVQSVESAATAPSPDLILDRVEPFKPARSYLFLKITGCDQASGCVRDKMPLGLSPLSDAEVAVLRQWIEQGALDN